MAVAGKGAFIETVKRRGRRISVVGLSAKVFKPFSSSFFRVIVPVSLNKKASFRNRLKRRVREILHKTEFPLGTGALFYPSRELIHLPAPELKKKVEDLIGKIK